METTPPPPPSPNPPPPNDEAVLLARVSNMNDRQKSEVLDFILHRGKYETNTNQIVKMFTGEKDLSDAEMLACAPVNAVETTAGFLLGLANTDKLSSLGSDVGKLLQNPLWVKKVYDTFLDQLTPAQKIAVSVENGANSLTIAKFIIGVLEVESANAPPATN
ncbi:MAG: hypothetical protein V1936_03090 [Patescibacteria group bacterium]